MWNDSKMYRGKAKRYHVFRKVDKKITVENMF